MKITNKYWCLRNLVLILQVRSVKWSDDDTHLVSCGMDGLVYVWDVLTRTDVFCNQSSCYVDVTFSPNSENVIAVDRNKICEIGCQRVSPKHTSYDCLHSLKGG